jgi:hypothetical protein
MTTGQQQIIYTKEKQGGALIPVAAVKRKPERARKK